MAPPLTTAALILASATCTVGGNLILKTGAARAGMGTVWPLTIVNGHVVAGAGMFVLAFLFYAMILRRLPLSVAQAIMAVQFVLVILAANVLLHESIGWVRWCGIALVAAGLAVVAISADARERLPAAISSAD